jgi:hypothetical protein
MRDAFGWTINIIIPALGLYAFNELRLRMREEEIEDPPTIYLSILFATYGGWVLVVFTIFCWYWSGMASLGLFYLLLIAPLVTLVMTVLLYKKRNQSIFHKSAFLASCAYAVATGLFFFVAVVYKALFAR